MLDVEMKSQVCYLFRVGETAESFFPNERFYNERCLGEKETSAEKDTMRGKKYYSKCLDHY